MNNIADKILKTLTNVADITTMLEDLEKYKENLISNSQNPVFAKSDRNKIMKTYTDLHEIGNSLARYKTLLDNNMMKEAKQERDKLSDVILKGGVSNYYCIWHADDDKNTCAKCRALDGTVYNYFEEIPDRPHPNCKCIIEIVEKTKGKNEKAIEKTRDIARKSAEIGLNKLGDIKENQTKEKDDYNFLRKKIREAAKNYSNKKLKGYKDANLLMQLALSPELWTANMCFSEYSLIQKWQNFIGFNKLSEEFQKAIPQNLPKVIFSQNSHLANSLNNSPELKIQINKVLQMGNPTHFSVVFEQDRNLFYAIHKAEIYDYRVTEDGYFVGYLTDTYDFDMLWHYYKSRNFTNNISTITKNDIAYLMQQVKTLVPYYLIVPIQIKL